VELCSVQTGRLKITAEPPSGDMQNEGLGTNFEGLKLYSLFCRGRR
jgi:hypothetical protein